MRQLLLLCALLPTAYQSFAQDVILKSDGEEITGKVITITPDQITYVSAAEGRSDTLHLASSTVFLIRYANGTKEVLRNSAAPTEPVMSKEEAYTRGRLDARKFYRAPSAFWGTYASTVVGVGYGGVVTGVVVGTTKPKAQNFVVPEATLLHNADYMAGYQQQAHKKKIGSVVGGFGAGVGTLVVVQAIILAVLFRNFS
ncbi:hypothetical protein [Hymenobacter crusticola]|uniref:Uncharacterized protein n=1 Tax=Hymenobacter crusticola TaxID=1770526 RepID=A0A243WJ51_9BACT|nr:hypothetical protein [Hymenobacter crusticola]OUJ75928.1 hypothetical protein BXP70_01175 [Hymenobacter crusticola]